MNDGGIAAISETLAICRLAFACLALLLIAGMARIRKPGLLLALALLANAFVWAETNAPLGRPYALEASHDRTGNVQLAAVVAAGRPFYESAQTGQFSIEPGWGLLAAAASGFDPERLVRIYPWFSLAAPLLVTLGIFVGLGGVQGLGPWERALAAYFGTQLVARPIDFSEYFSDPWAMMFLLKPNHALGLALAPLFLRFLSEAGSLKQRLVAGGLLGLIGWLCVFHMVFLWAALFSFVVAGGVFEASTWRDRVRATLPSFLTSAVLTAPYLFVLLFKFPAGEAGSRFGNPPSEALVLWATFQAGLVFALALVGLALWKQRGSRMFTLWASLLLGALMFWAALLILGAAFRARERDELLYWIRFAFAICAGAGVLDIVSRLEMPLLGRSLTSSARAALLVLATLPFTQAMWWNPLRMDRYFATSLRSIPQRFRLPGEWLVRHSAANAVVAGDPVFAKFISAFGGRRVYLSENLNNNTRTLAERGNRQKDFARAADKTAACGFAVSEGVGFLLVTRPFLESSGVTLADLRSRPFLSERVNIDEGEESLVVLFEINCEVGP